MKKIQLLLIITLFGFTLIGCKKDNDQVPLYGSWALSGMTINLDGNELINIPVNNFKTTFDKSSFNYSNKGQKSGVWSLNDDKSIFTVDYESKSSAFKVISKSKRVMIFSARTIDLTSQLISDVDEPLFVLINQELNQTGISWKQAAGNGQTMDVLFYLTKE